MPPNSSSSTSPSRSTSDRAATSVFGRLKSVGRRFRATASGARRTWRRSLQLRMVTYTLVSSSLLVGIFAVLVVERTTNGLVAAKIKSAELQIPNGAKYALGQISQSTQPDDPNLPRSLAQIVSQLSSQYGRGGPTIVIALKNSDPSEENTFPAVPGASTWITPDLREKVVGELNTAHQFVLADPDGSKHVRACLVVGTPVDAGRLGTYGLYYIFPMDAETTAVTVTRNTVLVIGGALVALLVIIVWLVTRLVVRPVRLAARTAQRLSAGLLDQRMEVAGEDDLAMLGASFNQMAANLQRQIQRLEEMSRLQRRFTSDVSHELRTPLTTVRMAADLLFSSRDELDPMMARSAELLNAELDRCEELLTDLLEISRFDAGFANLDAEPTDLVPVVTRVVDRLQPLAERVGIEIEIHIGDEPVIAEVDPRRAERILRNLVGNAVEHGERRPVVVTLAADASAVAITVRDHGIGLRPGEEKLVFNRFWRADPSRARQTGGTGLGLSISLEDARLHGGWLEAWGAPGQGAQFRLVLPVRAGGRLVGAPLPLVPADADLAPKPPQATPARAISATATSRKGDVQRHPVATAAPPEESDYV
jgi:two-component system, OmpR family, sensor histidine kinase MtrB